MKPSRSSLIQRIIMRFIMAALWLAGGIFLCIGIETEQGVMWKSYVAASIAFLMVVYNLVLAYAIRLKMRPEPEDEDAF
jgi:hypothetical protein